MGRRHRWVDPESHFWFVFLPITAKRATSFPYNRCSWGRVAPEYFDLLSPQIDFCLVVSLMASQPPLRFWNWFMTFKMLNILLCLNALAHAGCSTNHSLPRSNLPTIRYCSTAGQKCNVKRKRWSGTIFPNCLYELMGLIFMRSLLHTVQYLAVLLHCTIQIAPNCIE